MARPRFADRDAVTDATLSVRLTSAERARWDAFVAKQSAALRGTGARVTAASLARDVLVARLDAEGIAAADTAPSAAPAQQSLPLAAESITPQPQAVAQPTAATAKSASPFWYGIGRDAGAVEVIHPRTGAREEVEAACHELSVELRGPFETRALAWGAFEREQAELERRANAPPPPPSPPSRSPSPAPAPPIATEPEPVAEPPAVIADKPKRTAPKKAAKKKAAKKKVAKKKAR